MLKSAAALTMLGALMRANTVGIIVTLALILAISGCIVEKSQTESGRPGPYRGPYLGQTHPGTTPEIFAPGFISTKSSVRDMAISPDGSEMFYTLLFAGGSAIMHLRMIDSAWTDPRVATFSGSYTDLEPAFTPDGSRLYFVSKRPGSADSTQESDADIWFVEKTDTGWTMPKNIGAPVNTDVDEFYPSITSKGDLYFTAQYGESEDIWVSRWVDGVFTAPIRLSESINSDHYEFNAFVAPDERYIIFSSYERDDGLGGGDLYISYRDSDSTWAPAVNLGPKVNSKFLDFCPFVHGPYLFFTSNRYPPTLPANPPLTYSGITRLSEKPFNGSRNVFWMELEEALPHR